MEVITHARLDDLESVIYSDDTHTRSPGLHLSPILDILEGAIIPEVKNRKSMPADTLELYRTLGFIWESALTNYLNDRLEFGDMFLSRPGEIELDGIAMTPDGCLVDAGDGETILEEWKCTWRSPGSGVLSDKKFMRWFWQMKSYCYALGVTRANLRVLFVCGNYAPTIPFAEFISVEFSQMELEENWAMVISNAKASGLL